MRCIWGRWIKNWQGVPRNRKSVSVELRYSTILTRVISLELCYLCGQDSWKRAEAPSCCYVFPPRYRVTTVAAQSDDHGGSTGCQKHVKRHLSSKQPFLAVPPRQTAQAVTINTRLSFFLFVWVASSLLAKAAYKKLLPANTLPSRSTSMTLSSTSCQQRKSMLPKLRPSSRISARYVTSGDTTSRIARRVPSPLPEAGLRRAGSPSAGQTHTLSGARPTPDRSEASSTLMGRTPSPEVKKRAGPHAQYPTPPASAEIKHERFFKGQEGWGPECTGTTVTITAAQDQDTPIVAAAGAAAPPAQRHPSRRPASVSTTLTLTNTFSRVDNVSGGGIPALTWKKSAFTSSNFGGKENRRPRMYTRVPPPPVASAPTIPPCSIRRTVVAQPPLRTASFRKTPPPSHPLVIRKQLPAAAVGFPVRSASGASGALPVVGPVSAGIQTLIEDIDRFSKEWAEMFDELSVGAEDPEDRLSKLVASIRIRPTGQPGKTGPFQADNPAAAAGKGAPRQLKPGPSGSTASVNTFQASTLAGTNAETVHFDVTPASVTRWQHRDKSLVKETPEDRPVRDPNHLSKRLLTFNHYIRKETYRWWPLLQQQIRRQTKRITSCRKQSFETRLSR
jgi:hypothetical protein